MTTYEKDPQAKADFGWDWVNWLEPGDAIASHTVVAESGISLDSDSQVGTRVIAWLSGGTLGENYKVTFGITTASGRIDERTHTFLIRSK